MEHKPIYFDFHLHPSLKGSLTTDKKKYSAWNRIELDDEKLQLLDIFRRGFTISINGFYYFLNNVLNFFPGLIHKLFVPSRAYTWTLFIKYKKYGKAIWAYKIKQIINSQANFEKWQKPPLFGVVALIALEKAFAQSRIIYELSKISPLDKSILDGVIHDNVTSFELFKMDLLHLFATMSDGKINIIDDDHPFDPTLPNAILSVEGAHCFHDKKISSITRNFHHFKTKEKFKLLHLTLTHLTRQKACVHCQGTRIEVKKLNVTPNVGYRPDPYCIGINDVGLDLISIAYFEEPYRILIDIKHMSYVSRQQLYTMRQECGWEKIPLVASHIGVAGLRLKDARINCIKKGAPGDCDEIFWKQIKSKNGTYFNPWTLSLFDEDIEEVYKSGGLMGIILEERVLGYGQLIGEYMSPMEVAELSLKDLSKQAKTFGNFMDNFRIKVKNEKQRFIDPPIFKVRDDYQIDRVDDDLSDEISDYYLLTDDKIFDPHRAKRKKTHIDYLVANVLHVLEVGFKKPALFSDNLKPYDCICIGSDLDGIMDPINFPDPRGGQTMNPVNWVTVDKYPDLKKIFIQTLEHCIPLYPDVLGGLKADNISILELSNRFFHLNGPRFIHKHFCKLPEDLLHIKQ